MWERRLGWVPSWAKHTSNLQSHGPNDLQGKEAEKAGGTSDTDEAEMSGVAPNNK